VGQAKYSVLVVDDEPAITFILRMMLEDEGFAVETASCAREAIVKLGEKKFDAVVSDIRMETPTSGFDVLRAAKELKGPPIVVFMTAFPVVPQVWKEAGADELLVKGQDPRPIGDVLEELLSRSRSSARPVAPKKKKVVNE
jgi:DNA-binding NtrC family response regulator